MSWCISNCKLSQQTSCNADLQLSYCHGHSLLVEVAATGTVKANRMKNDPLWIMVKMKKEKRGSSDVVTDVSSNITAVRSKENNVVNVIFTFPGKQPNQQVKSYCHREKRRVNIEQPNNTNQCNMSMGELIAWI